ncbi:MAG TPA: ribose 5-phosphate isomerase B [Candidatus Omnitrophota bacterium]|nr:ribose 5-phosphate isomerase B [Candidatus Omnitrophota bacterium]
MTIFVGADHRGYYFKEQIMAILKKQGYTAVDVGSYDPDARCDYPEIAYKVATKVASSSHHKGILLCMSGIGQTIAANKVRGAYAALCHNATSAAFSRRHNNANILVLGADFVNKKDLPRILRTWLNTKFEGGRHQRRIKQIKKIEKGLKV